MKDSGKAISEMDMVNKFGEMEPNTEDNGKITKHVVWESLNMLMEICLLDNG